MASPTFIYGLVGAVAALTVYWLLRIGRRDPRMPPGPPTVPILGNMHMIPTTGLGKKFMEWSLQYGKIFSLKIGSGNIIVICDRKAVHELLDKKGSIYSDRPPNIVPLFITRGDHMTMECQSPSWREKRTVVTRNLNPKSLDEKHFRVQETEAVILMNRLLDDPSNFYSYSRLYASSVAAILAWGFRATTLDSFWYKDVSAMIEKWLEAIEPGATPPVDLIPWLWYIPGKWKSRVYKMRDHMDKVWSQARAMVDDRRARGDRRECMIDMKLDEYEKNGWPMSQHAFNNLFGELMEAGADTTANQILTLILALAKYPKFQEKARVEIDAVCGTERAPVFSDFAKMPYVNAIVKEGLRWRPTSDLGLPHTVTKDDYYDGMLIPKGSTIFVGVWAMHHDKDYYGSHDTFDPDRYLSHTKLANEYAAAHTVIERSTKQSIFSATSALIQGRSHIDAIHAVAAMHGGKKPSLVSVTTGIDGHSDVLLRHVRYFHPNSDTSQRERRRSDVSVSEKSRQRRQSVLADSINVCSIPPPEPEEGSEGETDQQENNHVRDNGQPQHQEDSSITVDHSMAQFSTSDLDALATVSMLQALHEQPNESTKLGLEDSFDNRRPSNRSPAIGQHDNELSPMSFSHHLVETTLETATPTLFTANAEFLSPGVSLSTRANVFHSHTATSAAPWGNNEAALASMSNTDLLHYAGALEFLQPNLSHLDFLDFSLGETSPGIRGSQASSNSVDPVSSIPLERFARVAALWPRNRTHSASQIASKVWADVVNYRGDGIFTDVSISQSSPSSTIGTENESRWGMDEEKRQDLIPTEKCCSQLATPSFGPEGSALIVERLASAALLLMAWSISSPHGARDAFLSRMLYNQTMNLVKMSGLLMPRPSSFSIDNLLSQASSARLIHDPAQSDDWAWKAWARTESFKRLISTLIMIDAWWASRLNTEPLICTSVVQLEMSTSIDLYRSSSAKSWRSCRNAGTSATTDPIIIRMHTPSITLTPLQETSPIGMTGLLSVVWARILQHQHQTRGANDSNREGPTASVDATTETGNNMLRVLGDIYTNYSRFLRYRNPNCIAQWHFLNLNILANLEIFEMASGRNGAESAYAALQEISNWSQTQHARRACLHAAGIYVAMSRRRANDGVMLHSDMSLFTAALVLGLYVFMMKPNEGHTDADTESFELLNDIDWTNLCDPMSIVENAGDNTASQFIHNGGSISFSGTVCEAGYNAAKMILLEFASLLEEVGKWNAKELCHILRIMSDSLIEVDDRLGGD
ncbi:oxidoreductase [Fusarium globosum]|uniref:Oxidoreductase n=1 Tax=Fusarium globosum TaxID=78864 RepID=A0A8H6DD67_9HYPO|nr:oxidoreductase [Fusarium globosum]